MKIHISHHFKDWTYLRHSDFSPLFWTLYVSHVNSTLIKIDHRVWNNEEKSLWGRYIWAQFQAKPEASVSFSVDKLFSYWEGGLIWGRRDYPRRGSSVAWYCILAIFMIFTGAKLVIILSAFQIPFLASDTVCKICYRCRFRPWDPFIIKTTEAWTLHTKM